MRLYLLSLALLLAAGSCKQDAKKGGYVTRVVDMHKVDAGGGETVYQAEGKDHGMKDLSFVITETQPGGGPPLHVHAAEEAHVVLSGRVTYFIADSIFTVDAPFLVRIPANTPHTFINSGDTVLNLIGVFGQDAFGVYQPVGKNPLK
jgi:mannose-6-phosphate isomerase-like protein (cupin superfamily)